MSRSEASSELEGDTLMVNTLCGKDKCQCQLSVQESNTKVTKPKHLTLRADQDAFADARTSRNGDLFI